MFNELILILFIVGAAALAFIAAWYFTFKFVVPKRKYKEHDVILFHFGERKWMEGTIVDLPAPDYYTVEFGPTPENRVLLDMHVSEIRAQIID